MRRRAAGLAVAGLLVGLCFGANACSPREVAVDGAVLRPGESVAAKTRFGAVTVSYVSPVARRYAWDGRSRTVRLRVRSEPFRGLTGLYDPAEQWAFDPRTRLVLQESVRDFESYDQLYAALREGSAVMDWVYTADGLVVGFGRTADRHQVNIDVFQVLVQGRKPQRLDGARPGAMRRSIPDL